jgi:hypothetical protein
VKRTPCPSRQSSYGSTGDDVDQDDDAYAPGPARGGRKRAPRKAASQALGRKRRRPSDVDDEATSPPKKVAGRRYNTERLEVEHQGSMPGWHAGSIESHTAAAVGTPSALGLAGRDRTAGQQREWEDDIDRQLASLQPPRSRAPAPAPVLTQTARSNTRGARTDSGASEGVSGTSSNGKSSGKRSSRKKKSDQ